MRSRAPSAAVVGLAALLWAGAAHADDPYGRITPTRDGTGRTYMGREIAQVMGHRGATWLERGSRVFEEEPDRVVEALGLAPTDTVADIGAGTGYFSFRLSAGLARGRVLAVDIQPEMLARIEARKAREGVTNIETLRGTVTTPNLPARSVDVALMVDAYHEFSHPREMMQALHTALRRGGRAVLVEYRGEDPEIPIKPLHKMTQAQVRRELEAVGFVWVETLDFLPSQHVIVFRRPDA